MPKVDEKISKPATGWNTNGVVECTMSCRECIWAIAHTSSKFFIKRKARHKVSKSHVFSCTA